MAESPRDMLTSLPYELRYRIAGWLPDIKDLGRLSVVNRTFHTMWLEKHERLITHILKNTVPHAAVLMDQAIADVVASRRGRGRRSSRKNDAVQAHIWIPEMMHHLSIVDFVIYMEDIVQPDDKILFAQVYTLQWQLGGVFARTVRELDQKLRSLSCREMHALATIGALEDDVHDLVLEGLPDCPRWPEIPNDWGLARLLADFYVHLWVFETGLGTNPPCLHLRRALHYKTTMIKNMATFKTRGVAWSGSHPHKVIRAVGERCTSCDHCASNRDPSSWSGATTFRFLPTSPNESLWSVAWTEYH